MIAFWRTLLARPIRELRHLTHYTPRSPAEGPMDMNDFEALTLTLYGEARGEGLTGMAAVASVVMNRVNDGRYGAGVVGVCTKPWQFSCWNPHDPNLPELDFSALDIKGEPAWRDVKMIARAAMAGDLYDRTHGATHYFNAKLVTPRWAEAMMQTATVGHHQFYRERK